jgi:hypothetical protein
MIKRNKKYGEEKMKNRQMRMWWRMKMENKKNYIFIM